MKTRTLSQSLPNAGYAALVDVLIATMGIFIVVFTQLQLDDAPQLVPVRVDGVVVCTGEGPVSVHAWIDGREDVAATAVQDLQGGIEKTWPGGARLIVGMTEDCAYADLSGDLWLLDTQIRHGVAQGAGSYLIEIAPVTEDETGPWSLAQLLARWRSGMAVE